MLTGSSRGGLGSAMVLLLTVRAAASRQGSAAALLGAIRGAQRPASPEICPFGPLGDEFPGRRGSDLVIPVASGPGDGSGARERIASSRRESEMPEHRIGTREQWQAARDELARLEAGQAARNEEIKSKRLDLPWVPVDTEYEFDTED